MEQKQEKKEQKNYKVIILILLLALITLSVGYALLSTNLKIQGTSEISKVTWDVHLENIQVTAGSVTAPLPTIVGTNTITYNVSLPHPGTFYEFTVDVKNGGTLPAKLGSLPVLSGVSVEQDVYTNYTVTYSDGTTVNANDALPAASSRTLRVRVEYDASTAPDQLPTENQTLNLSYTMNYIQSSQR